jgi:hypothetical protein
MTARNQTFSSAKRTNRGCASAEASRKSDSRTSATPPVVVLGNYSNTVRTASGTSHHSRLLVQVKCFRVFQVSVVIPTSGPLGTDNRVRAS